MTPTLMVSSLLPEQAAIVNIIAKTSTNAKNFFILFSSSLLRGFSPVATVFSGQFTLASNYFKSEILKLLYYSEKKSASINFAKIELF